MHAVLAIRPAAQCATACSTSTTSGRTKAVTQHLGGSARTYVFHPASAGASAHSALLSAIRRQRMASSSTCLRASKLDQDETDAAAEPSSSQLEVPGNLRVVLLGLLVAAAVALTVTGTGSELIEAFESVLAGDDSWIGQALFVAAYVAATVLLAPASILTLAAGALYGPLKGTLLVSAASTLGAAIAFLVSRYLAGPLVEQQLPNYPRVQAVIKGISSQGVKLVLLLRLSPLFPFNILNYALGVTTIGFWEYVGASWLGMIPGTVAYVALGGAGRAAADAAASGGVEPAKLALYAVGAAATLAVTKLASDAASRALKEQEEASEA